LTRQRFYELRARDTAFAEEWAVAVDEGTDRLEDEAYRRAVEGVPEPIFSRGEVVGERRVYSDRLIEFLVKARRPAVYREQRSSSYGRIRTSCGRSKRLLSASRDK
jgi:hypothetical protein